MKRGEELTSAPALEPRSGLSHDAIHAQLTRILASSEFHATERMRDFLRFVVEETLAGRSGELKGYTIATAVFERREDFDAAQDPIVGIQAGRLRRALERYYLVAGQRDEVIIDIPKGRYVPRFGAVVAEPDHALARQRRAADTIAPAGPRVAVMPLENLSPNPDEIFFTLGLAEELVTELNRFQDIIVIPCQRAAPTAGSPADMERLCRSLGARFLLGGSVRRDAESAKVSVRLVDATTGMQAWAGAFKHDLAASCLIRTQEEIARSVVAAIGSDHGVIAQRLAAESRKKPPAELNTYEAMLRYYSYMIAPSAQASPACFSALRAAVEREPEYGPAWSALATLHCQMYVFDAPGFVDPLETGLDYANRGVFLEPGRQLSRLILAYASLLGGSFDTFREEAEVTLALNPNNPYAVGTVGYMHVLLGDFEEGCRLLDAATAHNPLHPRWFHNGYFLDRFHQEDYQGAFESMTAPDENDFWQPGLLAAALGKLDRADEAAGFVASLLERQPDFPQRARDLLRRSIKVESLVDDLVDGFRRAGVPIPGV